MQLIGKCIECEQAGVTLSILSALGEAATLSNAMLSK